MDRLLIEEKLESLRRCLSRIEEKCPTSVAALEHDVDLLISRRGKSLLRNGSAVASAHREASLHC